MTTIEIVVLVIIGLFLLVCGTMFFWHSKKINQKPKAEKPSEKKDEKDAQAPKEPEQKPVPVGIIKEEKPKEDKKIEYDLAPFKDSVEEEKKTTNSSKKSVTEEIKSLSKDAKKVILSDILKPKY